MAGPAGALGASYNSPYLSVDGTYHSRPTGQASSLAGASRLVMWLVFNCIILKNPYYLLFF